MAVRIATSHKQGSWVNGEPATCHPEGVTQQSPGSHASCAPWGCEEFDSTGPQRGNRTVAALIAGNPVGVRDDGQSITQGALAKPRDPGLCWDTPSGCYATVTIRRF
jgi:hypothetical protein